jgi:hypothetical protein
MPSDIDELDELDGLIRRALQEKAEGIPSIADDARAWVRRARRRLLRNGVFAALAVVLAASGSAAAIGWLRTATPRPVAPPTPGQGRLVAALALPGATGLTFEGGSAWISVSGQPQSGRTEQGSPPPDPSPTASSFGAVVRVDPATHQVLATIELPDDPLDITSGFGAVWAPARLNPVLYRIDPTTNGVRPIALPTPVIDLLAADGSLWATSGEGGDARSVLRIDAASGRVEATIPVEGPELHELVALGSRIFARIQGSKLVEIDSATNEVVGEIQGDPGQFDSPFVATAGAIWEATCIPEDPTADLSNPGPCAWQVLRLDPRSGQVIANIHVARWFPEAQLPPSGLSTLAVSIQAGDAGLWVLTHDLVGAGESPDRTGQLLLVDPASSRVVATAAFEASPSAGPYVLQMDGHDVWVAVGFGDIVEPGPG